MKIEDAVGTLTSLYRKGTLVPFVGSGVVLDACRSWTGLLDKLEADLGVVEPCSQCGSAQVPKADSDSLYRRADAVMRAIEHEPILKRSEILRSALLLQDPGPSATLGSLARLYWPLIISTNYDDCYFRQLKEVNAVAHIPFLLGRSPSHCHRVVRSIERPDLALYWAIQGFIGGDASSREAVPEQLQREVVLGHAQYQQVTNAARHFRLAFARVWQDRSLLFLGSGLTESYFTGLVGEASYGFGPSSHMNFTFVREREKDRANETFLRTRLGTEPIYIKDFDDIPIVLNELAAEFGQHIPSDSERKRPGKKRVEYVGPNNQTIALVNGTVGLKSIENDGTVLAVSLGRGSDGPLPGRQAKAVLDSEAADWSELEIETAYVAQHSRRPRVLGIIARPPGSGVAPSPAARAASIRPAVIALLETAFSKKSIRCCRTMVPAAGDAAIWPAELALSESLAAIGDWCQRQDVESPERSIIIHIVNPGLWSLIESGRLDVDELLNSTTIRREVHVRFDQNIANGAKNTEYHLIASREATVQDLMGLVDLTHGEWQAYYTDIAIQLNPKKSWALSRDHGPFTVSSKALRQTPALVSAVVTLIRP